MIIHTVAVVGAGTMGKGIAQLCATSGFQVQLLDMIPGAAAKAQGQITEIIQSLKSKGKISEQSAQDAIARLHVLDEVSQISAELVIEAIIEKLEPKQQLFSKIQSNNPGIILATNTSTIPVAHIAAALKDGSRCVGVHFFNPAPVMKLVEVISSQITAPEVTSAMMDFCSRLGKTAVQVSDSPGFIVNRVARAFYLESLKILEEGVADKESLDALVKSCGFKMGPLELIDTIGVDVNLAVTESLYAAFNQAPRFRPSSIQRQLVADGLLGKKSGRGFYNY